MFCQQNKNPTTKNFTCLNARFCSKHFMVLCWFSSIPLLCLALSLRGWSLWTVSAASLGPWLLVGFMQWGVPAGQGEGRQWGQHICSTGFFPAGSPWLDAYFSFFHLILPCQILAAIPPLALQSSTKRDLQTPQWVLDMCVCAGSFMSDSLQFHIMRNN